MAHDEIMASKKLRIEFLRQRLDKNRILNDRSNNDIETAHLRGKISELKALLALESPSSESVNTHQEMSDERV